MDAQLQDVAKNTNQLPYARAYVCGGASRLLIDEPPLVGNWVGVWFHDRFPTHGTYQQPLRAISESCRAPGVAGPLARVALASCARSALGGVNRESTPVSPIDLVWSG